MTEERLQKLMARAGVGSRRACEVLIEAGRVTVNEKTAVLGQKADPARDKILVDGSPLGKAEPAKIFALYKPKNALSTDLPHEGDTRPTARSFIRLETRLFPIGRLDADSEGLMLFTNDGDLAQRLSHPRYEHEKEYRVMVAGRPDAQDLVKWQSGVYLEDGKTEPVQVSIIQEQKRTTWLRIIMREGRKRQIRRVAALLGHPVKKLIRERIGPVNLGTLRPGDWRRVVGEELRALENLKERPVRRQSEKGGTGRARRPF